MSVIKCADLRNILSLSSYTVVSGNVQEDNFTGIFKINMAGKWWRKVEMWNNFFFCFLNIFLASSSYSQLKGYSIAQLILLHSKTGLLELGSALNTAKLRTGALGVWRWFHSWQLQSQFYGIPVIPWVKISWSWGLIWFLTLVYACVCMCVRKPS